MIVSSFQSQYGLRLSRELHNMKWLEFKQLLSGLGPDTVLGRIVSIRAEDDKDILKHFSREQHRIRNEWLSRRVIDIPQKDVDMFLEELKQGFIRMAGGGANG